MIPALAAIFGAGAVCSLALARAANSRWAWVAAFVNVLLAFHEASFWLQPTAEWIRIDLLVTLPLFTCGNFVLAAVSFRTWPGWWTAGLGMSAVAVPVWFFLLR
jgi:hypothetical protein